MEPAQPLPTTLTRLKALMKEQGLKRSAVLNPQKLAAATALPEATVRTLLRGGTVPAGTVNERVRARIRALAAAYLATTGKPMSELAKSIHEQLGVSTFWARQVCTGEKVPSIELLHGLVGFFGVDGGERFFTAPPAEALNRALLPVLDRLQPPPDGGQPADDQAEAVPAGYSDVRGIALRSDLLDQARDLPPERWKMVEALLNAVLEQDDSEGER